MNTLTCAELLHYPGTTFTERLRAHHGEHAAGVTDGAAGGSAERPAPPEPSVRRGGRLHGALPFGRTIDLSRFTGRDRVERAANYLRAHVPRTETWGEDELRGMAARVLASAERVIE